MNLVHQAMSRSLRVMPVVTAGVLILLLFTFVHLALSISNRAVAQGQLGLAISDWMVSIIALAMGIALMHVALVALAWHRYKAYGMSPTEGEIFDDNLVDIWCHWLWRALITLLLVVSVFLLFASAPIHSTPYDVLGYWLVGPASLMGSVVAHRLFLISAPRVLAAESPWAE